MNELKELIYKGIQGEIDTLTAYGKAKKQVDEITEMLKGLKEAATDEAAKHPEKSFEHGGFKFEKRNGSKRFSFKKIEDWNNASKQVKLIEERYKAAYSNYEKGLAALDPETGEVLELPEVTYTADVLVVK